MPIVLFYWLSLSLSLCIPLLALYYPRRQVERLLSSQAFVLPVSAADAAAAGFTDNSETGEPFNSRDSRSLVSGSVKSAVAYTRSGEILGGGGGDGNDSSLFISNQVLQ